MRERAGAPVVFEKLDVQAGFGASGPVAAGLPLVGNVRGPARDARGDVAAGLDGGRGGRRRRLPHAGADPLLPGAARHRRRLAGGRLDRLHLDPVHRRRARGVGARVRAAAQPGARHRRCDGRRLRLEIHARLLRPRGGRAVAPGGRAGAAGVRPAGGAGRLRLPAGDVAAAAHRRAARRHADRDLAAVVWHRGHGARRRRRQRRLAHVHVPQLRRVALRRVHQRRARAAPCGRPAPCRGPSRWNRRSTNWPKNSAWIRSRCATASTRARRGARNAASAPSASAGATATRPAPRPARSRRASAWRQSLWGANVQVNSTCEVRVLRDGSVEVRSSVQDIGTGIGTVLAQVVAEELGLQPEDVVVRIGDTDFPSRPALARQPHHRLDHPAGAQRRLSGLPAPVRACRAGAGRRRR